MNRRPRPAARLMLVTALGLVLAACSAAAPPPSSAPSPSAAGKVPPSGATPPAQTPAPSPTCLDRSAEVDTIEPTVENLAGVIPTVVVGTFVGYGPGQWNTPAGDRPGPSSDLSTLIVRPARINVDQALRGDLAAAKVARVQGGQVGCNRETYSSAPLLVTGQRYVFFLQDDPEPSHKGSSAKLVGWAWPVATDGTVVTPLEGTVGLSTIEQTLEKTPLVVSN
jgi:hypothetical protein